jgi:hypothetical protein
MQVLCSCFRCFSFFRVRSKKRGRDSGAKTSHYRSIGCEVLNALYDGFKRSVNTSDHLSTGTRKGERLPAVWNLCLNSGIDSDSDNEPSD